MDPKPVGLSPRHTVRGRPRTTSERHDPCARCALRDDLHGLLGGAPTEPALVGLVDALCAADRPESIIVWKRSTKVQDLLRALGDGTIPVSHEGLDSVPGKPTEHLRAMLQHHGLLPQRDQYLPRFEQWIDAKLDGLPDEVRQPVRHFATWHHLRRIRAKAAAGASTRGPVHSAKQEITETVKFLRGLHETYERTAETCTQQDIAEWLAHGPTTRTAIRTFFVVAKRAQINTTVTVQHRSAKTSPSLSQDQRLAWIHELLTGTSESLPYRVAGMLLLLYAQPLVKVVTFPTSIINDTDAGMTITLGDHPSDVPSHSPRRVGASRGSAKPAHRRWTRQPVAVPRHRRWPPPAPQHRDGSPPRPRRQSPRRTQPSNR